jgi:hypothetical protein
MGKLKKKNTRSDRLRTIKQNKMALPASLWVRHTVCFHGAEADPATHSLH